MKFRTYQRYAIDSIFEYYNSGNTGNPIVVMPTGTGKSIVLAGFIKEVLSQYPGQRILKLTHVKELIEQNFKTLLSLWPAAPAGIYSSGIGRKDIGYPITFAGIASAVRSPRAFGWVDLVLIDECHLVSQKQDTQYRKLISHLREINPSLKVIGFTATHYRLGQGLLTSGESSLFTDVCINMSRLNEFNWFIEEGFLVPLVPRSTTYSLDVSEVSTVSGDYHQKDLQRAVDREAVTEAAIEEAVRLGGSREHWLVFASGIDHAVHISDHLNAIGISATYIHSKMSSDERDSRLRDFKFGRYRAMVNNGILTTGFDFPAIDLIVMLRPTQSPGLWVQMLGRGTRPLYAPGCDLSTAEGRLAAIQASQKKNCLVLDFAGNTTRLGPINDPVIPKSRQRVGLGSAPVRLCDVCSCYCHASLRVCPVCGNEFPKLARFGVYAGTAELVAREPEQPQVVKFKVDRAEYNLYEKTGKPTSLKVTYYSGLRRFNEWVCFEHTGYPRHKAHEWWKMRRPPGTSTTDDCYQVGDSTEKVVNDIEDFLNRQFWTDWYEATEIDVWIKPGTQYPEVMGYTIPKDAEARPPITINGTTYYADGNRQAQTSYYADGSVNKPMARNAG